MSTHTVINVLQWIEDNKEDFLPPVCNKMMHKAGQMKLFFVGGPNQRKDYHIEFGEELFMQLKGDMVLKVIEKGVHRDIHIRQGQIFLLPGKIAHSPQRFENTVGLVIERERREETEKDGLRYYVEGDGKPTLESLYEEWFHCTDLGVQLAPVIKRFFASIQYETGKPIPGTIPEHPMIVLDDNRTLEEPIDFDPWIDSHYDLLQREGRVPVFDGAKYQFQVFVYGEREHTVGHDIAETWIWQYRGMSTISIDGQLHQLSTNDSYLVPNSSRVTFNGKEGSVALVCWQDPSKTDTWLKA